MMGRKTLMVASTIAWALTAACGGDDGPTDPGNGPGSPTVTITAPASGTSYTVGQRVEFRGSATDVEDGVIPDASLAWSSNRDGVLGTGSALNFNALSLGTHTVTLAAVDSDAKTGTTTISVTVNEVPELPPVAPGSVILQDDMDNENGGNAKTNYTGFDLWNVVRQCVDLHGPGSIDPLPGNGLYIDMDGSCDTAGRMESKETFNLEPGTYKFELVVASNNQGGPTDNMTISVGTVFSQAITMPENEPFQIRDYSFTVSAASTGKIVMDHAGGDKQGILIDVIRLRKTN